MSKITPEQLNIIQALHCERLTSREGNRNLVNSFKCERNPTLAEVLRNAWVIDEKGYSAFYLIKDSQGNILFYFSLKCGLLYNGINEDELRRQKLSLESLFNSNEDTPERAELIKLFKEKYNISEEKAIMLVKKKFIKIDELLQSMNSDKESYSNDVTHRVQKTFASIELENFCANDATKEKWHDLKIYNPLGVIVFLFFVLPIVEEVRKGIGCEMLYLYAADSSDDEHLVNYYRSQLNFETYNDIGSSKPTYDFLCTLMCQNIHEALRYKDAYIESFNENR